MPYPGAYDELATVDLADLLRGLLAMMARTLSSILSEERLGLGRCG